MVHFWYLIRRLPQMTENATGLPQQEIDVQLLLVQNRLWLDICHQFVWRKLIRCFITDVQKKVGYFALFSDFAYLAAKHTSQMTDTDKVKFRRMIRTYHLKIKETSCLGCMVYYIDLWVGIMVDYDRSVLTKQYSMMEWNRGFQWDVQWARQSGQSPSQTNMSTLTETRSSLPWTLHHLQWLLWHHAFWISSIPWVGWTPKFHRFAWGLFSDVEARILGITES